MSSASVEVSIQCLFELITALLRVVLEQFMLALLEHSPDLYLDEIQEQLEVQHNVEVSVATIWRTLKRLGIGSKSVCPAYSTPSLWAYDIMRSSRRLQRNDVPKPVTLSSWKSEESRPRTLFVLAKVLSTY
jgi:hypothetical protein